MWTTLIKISPTISLALISIMSQDSLITLTFGTHQCYERKYDPLLPPIKITSVLDQGMPLPH